MSANAIQLYRRLLKYLKPHWVAMLLSFVGFGVFAYTQVMFAQLLAYLIDDVIPAGSIQNHYIAPLLLIGIFFIRGFGSFVGTYFISRVSFNITHTLRIQLFESLTYFPKSFFDKNNSGQLISRITYNVNQVTTAATNSLKIIIREGLMVIYLLGYLFILNWQLSLIFLVITPLIGMIIVSVGDRLRKLGGRMQINMGNLTHASSEMIKGHQVMHSFGGESYENERFKRISWDTFRQNLKMVTTTAATTSLLPLIVAVAMALLMFLALSFMGADSTGKFVAYLTTAALIPKSVRQLSEVNGIIQKGIAAAQSVFDQLDEPRELNNGTSEVDRVEGRLELKNVSFRYEKNANTVLNNISLLIEPGQTVALVGRSGSGKSTLANLIPRFYQHTEGEILVDGTPIQEYRLKCLRRQIAVINQNVTLFNDTVANNLAYGSMEGKGESQIIAAAKLAHAWGFIEALPEGINTVIGEDGSKLSGGQRQRLAIARALLKDAPILIMDEATSALDTESERNIQRALETVIKGRTTLVIAHRLSTIENADKIVVMDAGSIVEAGRHAELLAKNGFYARLHSMQFKDKEEIELN
jgi:ATP-binding cassette, subfamily B, bacterial MsbA